MILLLALAAASTPSFVPTPAEAGVLAAGEIVQRTLPSSAGRVALLAVADVRAPLDTIWTVLLDFPSRREDNAALQLVEEYRPRTATEQWWRYEVSRFGVTVRYHNHYVIDRARGHLLLELDPSMENDLAYSRGSYDLVQVQPGVWRVAYYAETDFGRSIPTFVQSWMGSAGMRDFLENLVRRAQPE